MNTNFLGDGLSVLILCEPRQADAWKSFATWYSFQQNAPDVKMVLATRRPSQGNEQGIIPWSYRLGLKTFCYIGNDEAALKIAKERNYLSEPILVVEAGMMLLDYLEDDVRKIENVELGKNFIFDVKNEESRSLIEIRDSCGGFVKSKWIDKEGHPFGKTEVYRRKSDLTINERRVLSLWSNLCPVYETCG